MDTIIKKVGLNSCFVKEERYFLDIETTGLCKQTDIIFCIGIMCVTEGHLTSYQWVIDNSEEEVLLLQAFLDFIEGFKGIITYSGKQFDIPFLLARLNVYNLPTASLDLMPHIDLKRFSLLKLLNTKTSLNRRELEIKLGFKRDLELGGRDIIKVYKLYRSSKSPSHRELLLQHNQEELVSAYFFYEFYYIFNQFSFNKLEMLSRDASSTKLKIVSSFNFTTSCAFSYMNLHISWEKFTNTIHLLIIPETLTLKKYLVPAKDYVYIPSQNQIMHKSVAQFIPKELKERVSKEQCFLTKKGSYIQLPSQHVFELPLWYDHEKNNFIDYTSLVALEDFWQYIKQLIIPRIS